MISFTWVWVYVLIPLPILFTRLAQTSPQQAIELPPRVRHALQTSNEPSTTKSWHRTLLLWLAWLSLLTAIAQPVIPGADSAQPASGRTVMLAIDLSSSMERRDFTVDGETVDRLTVVKQIAADFILARSGDRVGLVLFSTDTFIASPPSFDLSSVAQALASSGTGLAGRTTAIGDAIGMAVKTLKDDPAPDKAIVLLSDGTNNAGSVEPESAAKLAKQLGIPVHTIGLGSDPETDEVASKNTVMQYSGVAADLDEETLKSVAELSGGQFFRARTTQELQQVYDTINKLEGSENKPPPVIVQRPIGHYFTLALLCLMLLHTSLTVGRGWNNIAQ